MSLISCKYILSLSPMISLQRSQSQRDHHDSFASFREHIVFPTNARCWMNDFLMIGARSLTSSCISRDSQSNQRRVRASPSSPNYVIVGFLADSSCQRFTCWPAGADQPSTMRASLDGIWFTDTACRLCTRVRLLASKLNVNNVNPAATRSMHSATEKFAEIRRKRDKPCIFFERCFKDENTVTSFN